MTKQQAMPSLEEAARMALEAFEQIIHWYALRDRNDVLLNFVDQNPEIKKAMQAITTLRPALESRSDVEQQPATWIGLTNEDREHIVNNSMTPACVAVATEAKLKEKNT